MQHLKKWDGSESLPTFSLREINELETLKFIQKLSNSTAFGRDELDGLSMKVAAGHLKGPLTHLINVSIRTSQFASKWKLSRLIPILKYKDLSRLAPSSYRPVGSTSSGVKNHRASYTDAVAGTHGTP